MKFPLEIREQFRQFQRRFNPLKFLARAKDPGHLGKVIFHLLKCFLKKVILLCGIWAVI